MRPGGLLGSASGDTLLASDADPSGSLASRIAAAERDGWSLRPGRREGVWVAARPRGTLYGELGEVLATIERRARR